MQMLKSCVSFGVITVAAIFMYFIGMPSMPVLLEESKPLMCILISSSAIGWINIALMLLCIHDVMLKLHCASLEILAARIIPTLVN